MSKDLVPALRLQSSGQCQGVSESLPLGNVDWLEIFRINCTNRTEKAMAPHSSTLAWKIPWTEEPGGLQSRGSLRVRHDWATSLSLFTLMHWRRKWQPTPVFFPGESQGRGSLVGCHLWGRTESDTTEATYQQQGFTIAILFIFFCLFHSSFVPFVPSCYIPI